MKIKFLYLKTILFFSLSFGNGMVGLIAQTTAASILRGLLPQQASIPSGNISPSERQEGIKAQARDWMKNQPVQFLENKGQMTDDKGNPVPYVLFKAFAPQMDMYVTEKGLTYLFLKVENGYENEEKDESVGSFEEGNGEVEEKFKIEYSRIDMDLKGALIRKENIIKETASQADYNYFYPHCPEGIYGVKQYEKITVKDIYPGIDWVLYNSTEKGFKYDFMVHPGADPAHIKLLYRSEENLELDGKGNIIIKTPHGTLTENAPVSYLKESGQPVASSFTKNVIDNNQTEIAFLLGGQAGFPANQTLVIDPQLVWGTFFGGSSADGILNIDCDVNGNVYVLGYAGSINFPAQPWGTAYLNGSMAGVADAYILRFSNTSNLVWATYYGGSSNEKGTSITTDAAGNIYVLGFTSSTNFPTQAWGSAYFDNTFAGLADAFIIRFSNIGVRDWATYYGGSGSDFSYSVKADLLGNIYATGSTSSSNLVTQAWGSAYFDNVLGGSSDAFILRFSNTGIMDWATYYGGSGSDIAYAMKEDASGNIYIVGSVSSADFPTQAWGGAYFDNAMGGSTDAFILRFSGTGTLDWATYYGGSNNDVAFSVEVDVFGNIYVTGTTSSTDFPTQAWGNAYLDNTIGGTTDIFITRFNAVGSRDWSSFYGGSDMEYFGSYDNIASDTCGNVYFSFETISADVQTLNPGCGAFSDGTFSGGKDVFLVGLGNICQLAWATYIGSDSGDFRSPVAVDANRNIYISGEWNKYAFGSSLPVMNPGGGAYFDTIPNGSDDSYVMKFSPILPAYSQVQVNPVCTCNGSATANINCAIPPLNYKWSNGSQTLNTANSTDSITNLCPGNYWVEITDASCNRDTLFFLLTGSSNLSATTNATPVTCNGGGNGFASVTPSGGTSPYTYVWSPSGGTNSAVSGLSSGTHTVTVTDKNGCSSVQTTIITEPAAITASITTTSATCGNSDGSATINASGGSGVFTYNWLPGGGTNPTITNMSAGTYTIMTTDANGCTKAATAFINNLNGPSVTITSQTNISCKGGNNGSAAATPSGGSAPYTYGWNTIPAQTTSSVTGLSAGSYIITVTDAVGCSSIQAITVSEPAAITATVTPTHASCNQQNGSAAVIVNGGTAAYLYSWNTAPVQTTATATALAGPMVYLVTIRDANGCTHTASATLNTSNNPVIALASQANVLCNGGSTGNASIAVSAGTAPYTYLWNNGQSVSAASGLMVGTYSVTVMDALGCTSTKTVAITQPSALSVPVTSTQTSCNQQNASATVTPAGGTMPYTYLWSPSAGGQVTSTASGLGTGSYIATVMDGNGCIKTATVSITALNSPTITLTAQTNPLCAGSTNGSATISINGGTTPYLYSWNTTPVQNTANATGLGAGGYVVSVTDASGCTATQTVTITQPSALVVNSTSIPACGLNNGSATAIASGGASPYIYLWSPSGGTNPSATGLSSSNYSCVITDANGCTRNTTVNVVSNPNPTAAITGNVTITAGQSTVLTSTGGTSYIWSNGSAGSSITVSPPTTSPYCVTVTDDNGCMDTACVTVYVNPVECTFSGELYLPNAFSPNSDGENDVFMIYYGDLKCIKSLKLTVFNRWGEAVFITEEPAFKWDGQYDGKPLSTAVLVYYLEVAFINKETISKKGNVSLIK